MDNETDVNIEVEVEDDIEVEVVRAPCYRCLYPCPSVVEHSRSCVNAGVLGVVPGLKGCLLAIETIKTLLLSASTTTSTTTSNTAVTSRQTSFVQRQQQRLLLLLPASSSSSLPLLWTPYLYLCLYLYLFSYLLSLYHLSSLFSHQHTTPSFLSLSLHLCL